MWNCLVKRAGRASQQERDERIVWKITVCCSGGKVVKLNWAEGCSVSIVCYLTQDNSRFDSQYVKYFPARGNQGKQSCFRSIYSCLLRWQRYGEMAPLTTCHVCIVQVRIFSSSQPVWIWTPSTQERPVKAHMWITWGTSYHAGFQFLSSKTVLLRHYRTDCRFVLLLLPWAGSEVIDSLPLTLADRGPVEPDSIQAIRTCLLCMTSVAVKNPRLGYCSDAVPRTLKCFSGTRARSVVSCTEQM